VARDKKSANRRIEWMILVLGLAGIVAIFVPFAYGLSPLNALPVLMEVGSWVTSRSRAFEIYVDIAATTAVLAFFLAPLLSYAQLSRCLGRPLPRWQRKLLLASALVVTVGCVALVAYGVLSLSADAEVDARDAADLLGTLIIWILVPSWGLRLRRRYGDSAAEPLAMAAYIGGVATWGLLYSSFLEPTAVVAGFACVVHAACLWRRRGLRR
jgi:hypothetical protein